MSIPIRFRQFQTTLHRSRALLSCLLVCIIEIQVYRLASLRRKLSMALAEVVRCSLAQKF